MGTRELHDQKEQGSLNFKDGWDSMGINLPDLLISRYDVCIKCWILVGCAFLTRMVDDDDRYDFYVSTNILLRSDI